MDFKKCRIIPYSKSTRLHHLDHRIRLDNIANTLSCGLGGSSMSTHNFVKEIDENGEIRLRHFTPTETELFMSWRKDWTKYGLNESGKKYEIPKMARYKATGNGIVSVVSKAILEKLLPTNRKLDVYTTFSGVDGSTMLLDKKRFKKIGLSEFDPYLKTQHAANILRFHYPKITNFGDITKTDPRDVPLFNFMFASSPCQTFSSAGSRLGFGEIRGTLFWEVVRTLEVHTECEFLFFENVKGLLDHDKGKTFLTILEAFSRIGFELDFEVCNSKYFGVPQTRERVYLFGRRRPNLTLKLKPVGVLECEELRLTAIPELGSPPDINTELDNPKKITSLPLVTRLKERIRNDFRDYIRLGDFNIPLSNNERMGDIEDYLEDNVDESYYVPDHVVKRVIQNGIYSEERITLKTPKKSPKSV